MKVGIAADHGGFELKEEMKEYLAEAGYDIKDFGAIRFNPEDDYPDIVIPMAKAVAKRDFAKGVAICGSGVGACVAANKVAGARAALITDIYSAHQGVEDDDMNIICLGGRVTGYELAKELILTFIRSNYKELDRYKRRLDKIKALEK